MTAEADGQPIDSRQLSGVVRLAGLELGFARVGIAAAVSPPGFHPFVQWVADGYAADMDWIGRRQDAYRHPDGVMPGTRSVIVVAMSYPATGESSCGFQVARYARGAVDYHDLMKKRLKKLARTIVQHRPDCHARSVVDTAPLLERDFARLAGIGWQGKNTMLISREIGSCFFLGGLLTNVELDDDEPFTSDFCGNCTRCLDVCPTDAFPSAGVLDASKCISYLTIERRNKPVPDELKTGVENWVFGCDLCQEVCPWNRFAPNDCVDEFRQRPQLAGITILELLNLTPESFTTLFKDTPLERTGRDAIVRNACLAAANLKDCEAVERLQELTADDSELVRDAAIWACGEMERAAASR